MPSAAEEPQYVCPNVPARYRDGCTLDGYIVTNQTQRDALAAMRGLVASGLWDEDERDQFVESAVLLGPPGVGKSHLAAAACNAISDGLIREWNARRAEFGVSLRAWNENPVWDLRPREPKAPDVPQWVNVPSLVVDLKAEMNLPREDQERTKFARSLRSSPGLLVLDDLGRERISEWTGELVYAIVNDRYESRLMTAATSNLSADELVAAGYWPAISRLAEDGRLVEIVAPDHRITR